MIDLTTYALLRKQITTAASGISDVRAEGDELVFVLADGNEVRVAIPATEIRDAVVRDDVLVLTLEDDKEIVVDATLTQSGQAADAKVTGDALSGKLTEPSTGLEVGKYFRISAIDEAGHAVLEAADLPSAPVQDVQIDGETIVTDGVANVSKYDTVKDAMCDGKGAAWTEDEQAAARERIGLPGDYELIETFTLEEEATIIRNKEPDGTLYDFSSVIIFGETPVVSKTFYVVFLVNDLWMASVHCNSTGNKYYFCVRASAEGGRLFSKMTYATSRDALAATYSRNLHSHGWYAGKAISKFHTDEALPAGTVIKIYGVRA